MLDLLLGDRGGYVRQTKLVYDRTARIQSRAQAGRCQVSGAVGGGCAGRRPDAGSSDGGPGPPYDLGRHPGPDGRSEAHPAHQRDHPARPASQRDPALHAAGGRDDLSDLRPTARRLRAAQDHHQPDCRHDDHLTGDLPDRAQVLALARYSLAQGSPARRGVPGACGGTGRMENAVGCRRFVRLVWVGRTPVPCAAAVAHRLPAGLSRRQLVHGAGSLGTAAETGH